MLPMPIPCPMKISRDNNHAAVSTERSVPGLTSFNTGLTGPGRLRRLKIADQWLLRCSISTLPHVFPWQTLAFARKYTILAEQGWGCSRRSFLARSAADGR